LNREDHRGDVLTIPASRMKGKKDHAVPLTRAVLALIGACPRDKDAKAHPCMFSTTGGKRSSSTASMLFDMILIM
jgi:hypothetical protein